jgi:hypothetical protein
MMIDLVSIGVIGPFYAGSVLLGWLLWCVRPTFGRTNRVRWMRRRQSVLAMRAKALVRLAVVAGSVRA